MNWLRGRRVSRLGRLVREDRRLQRAAAFTASGLLARVIQIAVAAVSVPLTMNYLGAERYGAWMVLNSLLLTISTTDFGVGNGFQNGVAREVARGNPLGLQALLSSATVLLTGIGCCVGVGCLAAQKFISWESLLRISSAGVANEVAEAAGTLIVVFSLGLPLGLVRRVYVGMQEGHVANAWQSLGALVSLAATVGVIQGRGSLHWLVAANMGGSLLTWGFLWAALAARDARWRVTPGLVDRKSIRSLLADGAVFTCAQTGGAALAAAGDVVVAHVYSAAAVTPYAVVRRYIGTVSQLVAMPLASLWPAYADAVARRDFEWVRRALRYSAGLAFAVGGLCVAVAAVTVPIAVPLWTSGRVRATPMLIAAIGFQAYGFVVRQAFSMAAAGCGWLRGAAVILPVAAVLAFLIGSAPVGTVGIWIVPTLIGGIEMAAGLALWQDVRRGLGREAAR